MAALLLDINYLITSPYIPVRYHQEMLGIANGSGGKVKLSHLRRINFVPEITRAHCTIMGAWGTATSDGKLYHLRTLDWNPRAYVNQYPSIIIYDSKELNSELFANVGYLGMLGTLTAMSKIGITVGEKVMY
jgi:hypothetical protein